MTPANVEDTKDKEIAGDDGGNSETVTPVDDGKSQSKTNLDTMTPAANENTKDKEIGYF